MKQISKKTKHITIMIMLGLTGLFNSEAIAGITPPQPNTKIFKDWSLLTENVQKQVDVFYRIIECDTANYVELKVFNESSSDQTIEFDIEVKNGMNNNKFDKSINIKLKKGEIIVAPCTSGLSNNLSIELPTSYDPTKILMVSIKFK